ncbi:MAG: hypothetical protein SHS37scaffold145_30 [Phage 71_18]|nr:MAG: hypothetical protein SHS37scaffold145_30 [Phage 71_18]
MTTCRRCPAPIRWVLTENGKRMPVDLDPSPQGNVRISREGVAHVLTKDELAAVDPEADELLYLSHFVTCPNRPPRPPR